MGEYLRGALPSFVFASSAHICVCTHNYLLYYIFVSSLYLYPHLHFICILILFVSSLYLYPHLYFIHIYSHLFICICCAYVLQSAPTDGKTSQSQDQWDFIIGVHCVQHHGTDGVAVILILYCCCVAAVLYGLRWLYCMVLHGMDACNMV